MWRLQVLIPLALISLAATASAQTLTVTVDIPDRYKRSASEKCQLDEGTRAMFIMRFTPALDRYLHIGYRLLIDNRIVEEGASVSNPKGSQIASDTFVWDMEDTVHEPDGVHEYQLELLDANTKRHDYVVGTPRSRKVTVCDNDEPPPPPPVVGFATASSEVSEGAGTKNVAVTVDPAPQSGITLSYSAAGTAKAGSDYRLPGTVTVAPGVSRVNIPITIIDDEIEDSGETVVLTLSGGDGYTVGSLSRHTLTITNDDESPEASFAAASSTAEEGAGLHDIRIDLSPPPASGITIGYGVGGSAAAGSDYTSLSGSVTVPAGTSSVSIPVTITDDSEVEGSETVVLTLTGGTGYTVGSAGGHTLTITDNDDPPPPPPPPQPEATFAAASSTAEEGAGSHNIQIDLSPPPAAGITIGYGVGGSAAAGSDYTSLSGSVTVPAGTSRVILPVAIADDNEVENSETVELTLTGGTGYTVGRAGGHTLTITDNDDTPPPPPPPITDSGTRPAATPVTPPAVAVTVSISAASAEEGEQVTFTVRSEPAASSPLTLSWTVADGSAVAGEDYSESSGGTVTISAGASTATFQVATTDDRIDEGDETFTVTLSDDLPVGVSFAIGGKTATGTIRDDDTAGIALSEQEIRISGIGGSADYAVRLESEPEAPVTIAVASESPGVATVSPRRLVFTGSDWNRAKTVTVTGTGTGVGQVVHEASSVDGNYAGLQATVRIRVDDDPVEDDELPEATFATVSSTAEEGAGSHDIEIDLSPPPVAGITIGYGVGGSAAAGSDYTSLSGSVTVQAGTSRVILPVKIADDEEVESSETVELTLTGGTGYTVGKAGRHTLTITDNDPPPPPIADDGTPPVTTPATPPAVAATVSISDASAEEGEQVTFTVRSEPAASSPLTLSWTVADGSAVGGEDYTESAGGTVTIAAGGSTATIQVATTDDRIDEDDETFTVTLSDDLPVGVSFAADGNTATGTIRDDDTAGIALSEQALWISGIGGAADYTVRLESEPEAPVTIAVTIDTPGVAGVSPRRLVFTGSDWNMAKTVTVTGAGTGGAQVVHRASSVDGNYAGLQARVRIRVDDDLVEVAAPWLARFARTSAGNVLDGITNRRTALRTPGFEGAVAGRSIEFAARTDDELSISGDRLPGPEFQALSAGEVLPATAFALTSEQAEGGGSLALWGRGAWSRFEGIDDELTLEGGVATGILGIDGTVGSWLLGVALSHNAGTGGYRRASQRDGDVQATLTIAAPYAVGHVSDRLTVYGALGYGGGSLTVEPRGWQALETKTGFAMAAAGTRVDIVQAARAAGFGLTATTDAMLMRANSQGSAGDALAAFDADVSQLRVGLTGSWRKELAAFGAVQPRLEIGARHDGGHAETGVGLEIGGGVMWSVPALGIGVTAESRALIAHVDDRLADWGASAALSWDPAPASAVGPMLSLRHDWGGASSDGLGALAAATRFNSRTEGDAGQKLLTAEAVWGIALSDAGSINSPYVGFEGTDAARDYTLGWRMTHASGTSDLSLGVSATRREIQGKVADHLFGVELNSRW